MLISTILTQIFLLGIFIQAESLNQPLLVNHWPVGAQWYPQSCLLLPPALCPGLLPWLGSLGQPSKRHCLLPPSGEKVAGGIPVWPEDMRCFPPQSCTEVSPQEQDGSKQQFLTS